MCHFNNILPHGRGNGNDAMQVLAFLKEMARTGKKEQRPHWKQAYSEYAAMVRPVCPTQTKRYKRIIRAEGRPI